MAAKRKKGADESLTSALARLLEKTILPDLTERAKTPAVAAVLAEQHAHERAASRTADTLAEWTPRWLEQIGAAWVLSCVFLRTLEDRGLVRHRRIAGEGAADAEQLFFEIAPSLTARDYLLMAFREVARHPGAEDLLGPARNPVFRLSPSNEGARALLDFFREQDESGKELRWSFQGSDTRFLGDLYQDLSASVRERYALLQTPVFVEEFILDLTLEPAIATFGLEETHLIDPTCGSGHFLLGAFERICEHRMRTAPGIDAKEHALAALKQVHGVDLNPYAVAIARFRLTLAYLAKAGLGSLSQVPKQLPIEVVVADSLLHGATGTTRWMPGMAPPMFELEDPEAAERVFGRKYQAVVGNPPYITCKDAALREAYRDLYVSAAGTFALAAPFTQRFFQLGVEGGYVGLINANSFMKREFGKKLIEEVLAHLDLTRVIDTSGAYIPGHGTPTVLLFGRNQRPAGTTLRALLGKRGEPEIPQEPEKGKVWSAIVAHFQDAVYDDEFVSVRDVQRSTFSKHPWSVGGGGVAELKSLLEQRAPRQLSTVCEGSIGRAARTGEDDAYTYPAHIAERMMVEGRCWRDLIIGEAVRDWGISQLDRILFPYSPALQAIDGLELARSGMLRHLWPLRTRLAQRSTFQGVMGDAGLAWYEYMQYTPSANRTPLSIVFAFVATHNHFVLDRGGKVFKQSAPIIKLPEGATEEDHLALLGYLNSSTACFWMKQVSNSKGAGGIGGGHHTETWSRRLEFDGSKLAKLPIFGTNSRQLLDISHRLDQLGRRYAETTYDTSIDAALETDNVTAAIVKSALDACQSQRHSLRSALIAGNEELDWIVYAEAKNLMASPHWDGWESQGCSLGTRAFEIVWARERQADGAPPTDWFTRHGGVERVVVPDDLPKAYRSVIEWRIARITENPELRLIESPDYKRRWSLNDESKARILALRSWILRRIEQELSRQGPPSQSSRKIALHLATDRKWIAVTELLAEALGSGSRDLIVDMALEDAVPYLAALRYTPDGLETRAQWENTWALQRREDAGEKLAEPIPVPPKYDVKDFRDPSYFRLRGKLDVPKERFISYPGAERDDDKSPLFGWAGWNHLERATALAGLYQERKTEEGWGPDRLTPLLAGILELVPWLKQWHNEMNEEFGERLGDYYERYVDTEARALGLTLDALRAWRPEAKGRKGRGKKGAT